MQTDTSWLTECCYALQNVQWRILYLLIFVKEVLAVSNSGSMKWTVALCSWSVLFSLFIRLEIALLRISPRKCTLTLFSSFLSHFGYFSHTIPLLIFVLSRIVSYPYFRPASRFHVFILPRWFPPLFMILHPFLSPYHFYVWTLLLLPHLCKYMSPRSMLDTFNFPYNKLHPLAEGSNM